MTSIFVSFLESRSSSQTFSASKSQIVQFSEHFVTALDLHAVWHLYVSKSREVYAVGCLLTYQTLAQPANYQQTKTIHAAGVFWLLAVSSY